MPGLGQTAEPSARTSNFFNFGRAELTEIALIDHTDYIDGNAFRMRLCGGHDRTDSDIGTAIRYQ